MVDARNYASKYIKPDQVRDGPVQTRVVNVYEDDRYGRLMLELEIGSRFGLNDGNTNTLIKAWGYDTDAWIGQEVVFELGHYTDWNSKTDPPEQKETVRVVAVSPPKPGTGNSGIPAKPPLPPSKTAAARPDDMDDSIPFVLAFFIVSAVTWLIAGGNTLIA
jgi:hypothetical protein